MTRYYGVKGFFGSKEFRFKLKPDDFFKSIFGDGYRSEEFAKKFRERFKKGAHAWGFTFDQDEFIDELSENEEVLELFKDWLSIVNEDIRTFIKQSDQDDPESIAKEFKISIQSAKYFLKHLNEKEKTKES